MNNRSYGILMSLGLAGIMIGIASEISAIWAVEQNWAKLLSLTGKITISLYLLLLFFGLFFLLRGSWRAEALNRFARSVKLPTVARWLFVVGLLFVFTYLYLFSAWQTILSQPWAQLLFAMGLAQIILFTIAPEREQTFGWSELALTLGLFLPAHDPGDARAFYKCHCLSGRDSRRIYCHSGHGFCFIFQL